MTNHLQIGREDYWDGDERASGPQFHLGTQYRFGPGRCLEGAFSLHSLRRVGSGVACDVQYEVQREGRGLRAGFRRSLRYDSMLALAGRETRTGPVGAASDNLLYAGVRYRWGRLAFDLSPYGGWVSATSATPNLLTGAEGRTTLALKRGPSLRVSLAHQVQLAHYGRVHSGLASRQDAPAPGGYFSPRFFLAHTPRLELDYASPGGHTELEVSAGPAVQFVRHQGARETYDGLDLRASYRRPMRRSLYWTLSAAYTQVADVYIRYSIDYGFSLVF